MHITTRALRRAARAIVAAAAMHGGVALAGAAEPLSAASTAPLAPSASPAALTPPRPSLAAVGMPAAPIVSEPATAPQRKRTHHVLGLSVDAGVPDGASATVLYRPWRYLRFGGGMLYNYVGYGVLGSVSVLPYFPVAPSLTLEAGHYFDANASARVAQFTRVDDNLRPLLQRVGYTFVNAQVGLELGHPNWFVFFVRAGLSRVWLSSSDANKVTVTDSNGTRITFADPSARLGIPTAKVGLMFFFY